MQSKKRFQLGSVLVMAMTFMGCSSSSNTPEAMEPNADAPTDDQAPTPPQNEDPTAPGADILNPVAQTGSDTERLFKGIQRQVAITLIDLNTKLRQGETLSAQQENCLGAFDPAFGEQLLSINCAQSLVTSPSIIRVENAAYHDTAECQSGLTINNSENCILQSARLSIPTEWVTPPAGQGTLPQPIAGMEIYYAIEGTVLRIESSAAALTGIFSCELDLTTVTFSNSIGQSCADIIATTADRFDALLPES